MGEFVGLADDEILENEAVIESQELRLVVTDFKRQNRSDGSGQGRRGFRVIIPAGEMIAVRRPRRHADNDREAPYLLVLRPPQREKPIRIMGRHPVAQKTRGRRDDRLSAVDVLQVDRLQPVAEGVLANFRPELTENLNPLRLARCHRIGRIFFNCLRHPLPPTIEQTQFRPTTGNTTYCRGTIVAVPCYSIREETLSL